MNDKEILKNIRNSVYFLKIPTKYSVMGRYLSILPIVRGWLRIFHSH